MGQDRNAAQLFEKANKLYNQELYEEALPLYQEASQEYLTFSKAGFSEVHFGEVKTLIRLHSFESGIISYSIIYDLIPDKKKLSYSKKLASILIEEIQKEEAYSKIKGNISKKRGDGKNEKVHQLLAETINRKIEDNRTDCASSVLAILKGSEFDNEKLITLEGSLLKVRKREKKINWKIFIYVFIGVLLLGGVVLGIQHSPKYLSMFENEAQPSAEASNSNMARITATDLNIRSEPTTGSKVIGSIEDRGTQVTVLDVYYPANEDEAILNSAVTINEQNKNIEINSGKALKIISDSGDSYYVSLQFPDYGEIRTSISKSAIERIGGNEWYKIRKADNTTGWVYGKFVDKL
jgi:tetratricopeptide (TPR) repeat protein